jgi:hypothetical protein
MKRTTASGNVNNRFLDGDPSQSIMGTVVDASWLNSVQEELANAIEGMGGVLDPANEHQLKDALLAMFAASHWKDPVATVAALPASGNSLGDCRQVTSDATPDNNVVWSWNGTAWVCNVPPRMPPGTVVSYAASTVPTGWLECNGAAISRTTYASLFAAIGTVFGIGNGSSTFNLPDLRGYFVRGYDNSRGVDPSREFGSNQTDDNKSHAHYAYGDLDVSGGGTGRFKWVTDVQGSWPTTRKVSDAGGLESRPKNIALMFLIKY